jgi:hypothetical protein
MANEIEIWLGDVTDMEAHVFARYVGSELVELTGTLRGPFCEIARTLPADFAFHKTSGSATNMVEALVTEPCLWSREMPQLYRVDIRAETAGRIVAEYHGEIGLQRLAPRRPVDFAPGTG